MRLALTLSLLALLPIAGCSESPVGVAAEPAFASMALTCPSGWTSVRTGRSVILCKKSFSRGGSTVTDYVQVVNLGGGARVLPLTNHASAATSSNPSPSLPRYSVASWWSRNSNLANRFCMTNGAFFTTSRPQLPLSSPAPLSFPMKFSDYLVSAGSEGNATEKRVLVLDGSTARIVTYTPTTNGFSAVSNALSSYRNAVVGRHPENTGSSARDDRTYAGVRDADGNGTYETVIFYSSPKATWQEAQNVVEVDFRAYRSVQFDGSDSSQLHCNGTSYLSNSRPVPQAFAILQAP